MPRVGIGSFLILLVASVIAFYFPAVKLLSNENFTETAYSADWTKLEIALSNPDAAVKRFAGILRFRTISSKTAENHIEYPEDFRGLHKYFRQQWPLVFQKLQVTTVSQFCIQKYCDTFKQNSCGSTPYVGNAS